MKQFIGSIISILFVQFGLAQTIFEGTLPTSEGVTYQLYLKEINSQSASSALIDEENTADDKGRFKFSLPSEKSGFFTISIILNRPNGQKSNTNSVIYLQSGKKLKINFVSAGKFNLMPDHLKIRDKNNKALLEIQNRFVDLARTLFEQPSDPVALKSTLLQYYSISDSILNKTKILPAVRKYIEFLSFDQFNANMYRFGMDLSRQSDLDLTAYYTQPKNVAYFMNDELLLSFYTGMSAIGNYLDLATGMKPYSRRKSMQQIQIQIDKLKETVNNKIVNDAVVAWLLEGYVGQYRPINDFDQDLKDYTSTACQIADSTIQQQTIQSFENLRYTLKNAPWVNLQFRTTTDELITLDKFKGKYVFIDVWASWCVPCIQMIPHLQELEHQYKGKNIEFIALSIDADPKKWIEKVQQLKLEGNQIRDEKGQFANLMNISGIPHYLLYDMAGKLIEYKTAAPNAPQLKVLLDKLLNN